MKTPFSSEFSSFRSDAVRTGLKVWINKWSIRSHKLANSKREEITIVRGVYLLRLVDKEHSDHCDGAYSFSISVQTTLNPPGGGYLGQFLLGMCRWPLRTPTPLQYFPWPIIDPILVTFGLNVLFAIPS